jgi:hypothetical protein
MTGISEELEGVGSLELDGNAVGEVLYSIQVHRAGPRGWSYPFARFRPRGYTDFHSLVNKAVVLVLSDGRRWECSINSLDGSVVAKGDWPAKPAAP